MRCAWIALPLALLAGAAQAVPGDIDCSGRVDIADFWILVDHFGQEGPPGPGCGGAGGAPAVPPITIEGTGTQVTAKFQLKAGLAVFEVEYPEEDFLIVHLIDGETGEIAERIFSESSGATQNSKAVAIEQAGEYLLNVESVRGAWTITVQQD